VSEDKKDRLRWLAQRQKYIGSSDITRLLGTAPSSWGGAYRVWSDKTADITKDDIVERFYWGHRLEPIIAEEYELETGQRVEPFNKHYVVPWPASGYAHVAATPDYFASDPATADTAWHPRERVLVECKTVHQFMAGDWGASGSNADGNVPAYYAQQVRWQLGCIGSVEPAVICALIGGVEWRQYYVEPDQRWFDESAAFADEWYAYHVLGDNPPVPDQRSDIILGTPPTAGNVLVADDDVAELIAKRVMAGHLANERDETVKRIDAALCAYMGDTFDSIRIRDESKPAVTWKTTKTGARRYSFRRTMNDAGPSLVETITDVLGKTNAVQKKEN
jgi:putative phage-type endonuclease